MPHCRAPKMAKKPPKRSVVIRLNVSDQIRTYSIINPSNVTSQVAVPLGEGGSGIVFLAAQRLHRNVLIKRAIKFFMYRDNIAQLTFHEKSRGISSKDFLNEIVNISEFSHENLVKVTDAGVHRFGTYDIPYIVTDFVEGPNLKQVIDCAPDSKQKSDAAVFRASIKENPSDILRILIEAAAALQLLHEHRFLHCDIAPKNIFLKKQENFKVIVGDLGVGRSMTQGGRFRIVGSKEYMPPELLPHLYRVVSHQKLRTFFPRWDLFAFAKTGLEVMGLIPKGNDFPWINPLKVMLEECRDGTNYKHIMQVSERIRWLLSVNRSASDVPELSPTLLTKTRRLMPVEPLATTDRVRTLSWHPALLRLAKVPQLTAAPHIFPGAVHTRYEHSLGAMETMRRYLMNLVGQNDFQEHLSSSKIETALLCALFSSLTRFPFSTIIREIRGLPESSLKIFAKEGLLGEIFAIKDSNGHTLVDLLKKHFPSVDVGCVRNILGDVKQAFTKEDELIYSLLNCSLDVRVIDFVRRDSLHLGVSRQTFDLDELLAHLKIHHHRLAIAITGVSIAEEIITLRYTLFNRIYWNRPNRAFVAMVRHLILTLGTTEMLDEMRQKVLKATETEILQFLLEKSYDRKRKDLINMIEILMDDGRRQFQVILEASPKEDSELSVVCQRVRDMNHLQTLALADRIAEEVKLFLPQTLNRLTRVPVLIDIPTEPGTGNKLGDDILVIYPKPETKMAENLSHASGIVKGVNDSFNEYLCRMRILLHPDLYPGTSAEREQRLALRARIKEYLLRTVQ